MFEKLTYGGTECNNYLYFSFYSNYFEPNSITERLDINPTSIRLKKEPFPVQTSWNYKIEGGAQIDLEKLLIELIAIFESKIDGINSLKKELNLETRIQFKIDIDIDPEKSTPYFGLNKRVIEFLYKTGTTVDYDLYKTDSLDLL